MTLLRELLHIGVVVDDLERAAAALGALPGVAPGERWASDLGVRVAFFEVGGARICAAGMLFSPTIGSRRVP